jgi:TPR repeat protein
VPLSKSEARKLAEDGDPVAQCDLGRIYENAVAAPAGRYQVRSTNEVIVPDGPGDYEEAVRWYRKAADQGHAVGQWCLGIAYENGDGVIKDPAEAARWYLKAAEQGHAAAQWYLGDLYESGEGVDQDSAEAVRWYRRSADGGNSTGQSRLTRAMLNLVRPFCEGSG